MTTPATRKVKGGKRGGAAALPPGAWHTLDALWGDAQRVRLVTGPPSLVGDAVQVRSIHVVAFCEGGVTVLLVENKDGSWTFPGGRLEGNETLDQALIREVWEEARATIAPDFKPIAATRIDFLNRVPGRVYRVHPSYLLWVTGNIASLSDEPHHDPADNVVGRRVCTITEAIRLLGPLEQRVLEAALEYRKVTAQPGASA
jgi:8-oxo-dGTP pyrophosphatase MutT (NUDIX family)